MPGQLGEAIAKAPPIHFWGAFALFALLTAFCCWRAFVNLKRKRIIEDLPTSLLRSAAQGYVELKGRAALIDGEAILGPLTGLPCTWFRFRVEERQHRADRSGSESIWKTIDEGISDGLFYLVDATGRCVIDPEGAVITPSDRVCWYGRHRQPDRPPGGGAAFWQQLGCNYRYSEERIAVNAPLYALGMFTTHGGADAGRETEAEIGVVLRRWKADPAALLRRFDRDRDGRIDMDEWESARSAAAEEVLRARTDTAPLAADLLHRTGDPDRPFILSAVPEDALLRRLAITAFGQFVIGTTGLVALFWAFTQRLAG